MATTGTRLSLADHGRALTLDEFAEADGDEGYRYELAGGRLDVIQIPAEPHAQIIHNIHAALFFHSDEHPGLVLRIDHGSEIRILVEPGTARHPDLAVIFQGAPIGPDGRRRPSLVVEVVSPGAEARRRDLVAKRADYLDAGLPEYWIVDPANRAVIVLVRVEGPSWDERRFSGDQAIDSTILPGFRGTVEQLWADVDLDEPGEPDPT